MNRLDEIFARDKTALVTYLCAGDPSVDESLPLFQALADAGADVLEIGVPFSDPGADGPAIQRSAERALASGATLEKVLEMTGKIQGDSAKVLFGYLNPFLSYGYERLAARCAEVGIHGLLVVDCPPEEEPELRAALDSRNIHPILLIAPTTPDDRIAALGPSAGGFAYYVSMAGVTGAAFQGGQALVDRIARVRKLAGLPVAVGFGIATPQDAASVASGADGVVVGSALVRIVEAHGAKATEELSKLTAALKAAI